MDTKVIGTPNIQALQEAMKKIAFEIYVEKNIEMKEGKKYEVVRNHRKPFGIASKIG